MKTFKLFHEQNRMANVIRFSIETIQAMEFWKTSDYFVGQVFPQKKTIVFQWKHFIFKFSLDFYSASFPSLKALTGCLEKIENLANWFGL